MAIVARTARTDAEWRQMIVDAAVGFRRVLETIARDEVVASPVMVARLEGAATALEALLEPTIAKPRS